VTATAIAEELHAAIGSLAPTMVLLPMGLANPEHVAVHDAVVAVRGELLARTDTAEVAWFAYEDIAYKHIPGQLAWRVASLFKAALWPTPVAMPIDPTDARKRDAMAMYVSQVKGLEADWGLWERLDAPTPEQYWRLAPPPPGWEAMIDLV
jgi:LmbE family N-acetylglucosaminyl deacetylase